MQQALRSQLWSTNNSQITFIFILILFLDSVNRVYRVQQELHALANDTSGLG